MGQQGGLLREMHFCFSVASPLDSALHSKQMRALHTIMSVRKKKKYINLSTLA